MMRPVRSGSSRAPATGAPLRGTLLVVCLLAITHAPLRAAVGLNAIAPMGATAAIPVQITGTGFASDAQNNEVILTPASGAPVTVAPFAIAVLNSSNDLRRLAFNVPAGLAIGPAAVQVRNRLTGEVGGGLTLQIIDLQISPPVSAVRGASNVAVRVQGTPNTAFVAGRTVAMLGPGITVNTLQVVSATELALTVTVAANAATGARLMAVMTATQNGRIPTGFEVVDAPPPNRNPSASANGPYDGLEDQAITFSSAGSSDPDNDPLQFAWDFGDGNKSADANPLHVYSTPGTYTATLVVSDGRGGSASATATVSVAASVALQALSVEPGALRFSEFGATAALAVTGHFSDGTTRDLTAGATGTVYAPSPPGVVSTGIDGLVTALANGTADISVTNGGQSVIVPASVEEGVTLLGLDLVPPIITLRELSTSVQAVLRGSFSDGSLRDLTGDPGTTYVVDDESIATVNNSGLVTASAPGAATLSARFGGLAATSQVRVVLTDAAPGFLQGEVFDDTRSVPLSDVTATVIASGGTAVTGASATVDSRGRFALAAGSGDAIVRLARPGYTSVDRSANLAANGITTLLDARLTPLDPRTHVVQSVFGGEATSADGTATLSIPAGSIDADATLRITPISNQGLAGLLPPGWSPIAAVDVQPADRQFAVPATLRVPHVDSLAAGLSVAVVRYDPLQQRWIVQPSALVSADRRTLSGPINATGQFAFIVPDAAPAPPPPAIPGDALAGVSASSIPDTATASGAVVPRSAPPGDSARAVGTIVLQPPAPLTSGAVLRARVSEQFNLLDQSAVQPLPFVQDVVLYARPRLGEPGSLGTRLPITPSLHFSIQQLSLGTVRLDITRDEPLASGAIVGTAGGSVTDAVGNVLELPAGVLAGDAAISLLPLNAAQLSAPVPGGFALLGAMFIDAVGLTFADPALLSIPRPGGLDDSAQVLVAHVINDPSGGRRFRLVGVGELTSTRVVLQRVVASLTFDGVRSGGEYVFLHAAQPVGFVTGRVTDAAANAAAVLVTSDTAPFAFVTDSAGTFVVAGLVGATTISAIDPAGATASAPVTIAAGNAVASLDLALTQTAPTVLATTPSRDAKNVPLDAPAVIDFSKAIDPATINSGTVVLTSGGTVIPTQSVVSANRRRVTVTPISPLAGLTVYALALSSEIRDAAGVALTPFTPLSFTTLDPTKATQLGVGAIVAELPDEDSLSLLTGGAGAAEPGSAVVVTNLRTQETITTLALADGSFRLRLRVTLGDSLTLTLRDSAGRETTLPITQFSGPGDTTGIGEAGGTIEGPGGRSGRILPRALSAAGTFQILEPSAGAPPLAAPFAVVDQFTVAIDGASFRRLDAITLTESQGRFAPAASFSSPFAAAGSLTVPPDFLVSASLGFNATVSDRDGVRRSAAGTTVVVAAGPDQSVAESGGGDQFPIVYLSAPKQAVPGEVVAVSAIAPAARVDLDLPTTAPPLPAGHSLVLARLTTVAGETRLALVDRLSRIEQGGLARLRTDGREMPGVSRSGDHVVVSGPLAFITGRASGPVATVVSDGSPFIFETESANGVFTIAVPAAAPFTLLFVETATGALLGTATGQAPAAGATLDVGAPLTAPASLLSVTATPDAQSIVDTGTPLVFRFSEPLDRSTVTPGAFVVTDPAGARAYGRLTIDDDERTVMFVPLRRWQFATRYRYGVAATVVASSGARMAQPLSGEFTTYTPRVLHTSAVGSAYDVDVAAGTAAVATSTGLAVLDVSASAAPKAVGQIALPGGARGIALLHDQTFDDRAGTSRTGTFALVASGNASTEGRLEIVDVTAAPAAIGSAQLTISPGQVPPSGVAAAPGTPKGVAVPADERALVAIEGIGLASVNAALAVPVNPPAPGSAVGPRYPAASFESIHDSFVLGDRVVTAGVAGLTSLDSVTLERRGGVATGGEALGVSGAPAFVMDFNGDGLLETTERFDLAVVANGQDGTVQLFNVPATGDPVLLSVVRLAEPATGVVVDRDERLAYVAAGTRGVAIVDLEGPASLQPIDQNRDGRDDRILGLIDTPGTARRLALALDRGLGFVADGAAGLSIVQLLPPRTRFLSVHRDPIVSRSGDEESLSDVVALRADDGAVRVVVNAVSPDQSGLFLRIDEVADEDGVRRLSFADGSRSAALSNGLNEFVIPVTPSDAPGGSHVNLLAVTATGALVATTSFRVEPADIDPETLQAIFMVPLSTTFAPDDGPRQLTVGGVTASGLVVNLSAASTGTTYVSGNPLVVDVTVNGLLVPQAGGLAEVLARNGVHSAAMSVRVDRGAVVQAIEVSRANMTFTRAGEEQAIEAHAELTDGSTGGLASFGATFASSDEAVATVSAAGRVTAVGNGTAVITVRLGSAEVAIRVAVEFRTPAVLTALEMQPFAGPAPADQSRIEARATVTGTGSLEGISVSFAAGSVTAVGITDYDGVAVGVFAGPMAAGTVPVTASVVNPSGGATLADTELLTVIAAGADSEPNDSISNATPVTLERRIAGALGGGDVRDVYRTETRIAGSVSVALSLATGTDVSQVRVLILDAAGVEVARFTPTALVQRFTQAITAGDVFVAVETLGAAVNYSASLRYEQGTVAIQGVAPLSGGPGTPVVITGSGFSTSADDVRVLFGGIAGRVTASTPTRIDVLVPAFGKDGPVTVIATSRRAVGPNFVVGSTAPRPAITSRPSDPAMIRFDPIAGVEVDVSRLNVFVDPVATRAEIDALAQSLGGAVVGENVVLGMYLFEFDNQTLAGLAALERQLAASAIVRFSSRATFAQPENIRIDLRDHGWVYTGTSVPVGVAFGRAKVFEAIEAIRNTPPYDEVGATFQQTGIAIIDSGFQPAVVNDFISADGQRIVRLFTINAASNGVYAENPNWIDLNNHAHGTSVTSIIGALNNGNDPLSGGYGGLFHPGEASFEISNYAALGSGVNTATINALSEIADRGDINIVNMSLGADYGAAGLAFENDKATYREAFMLLGGSTLVVTSAGNAGTDAALHTPSILSTELPFVIAVGATAVANLDGSGEGADSRASFSNYGDVVTFAAPGEDVFAAKAGVGNYTAFRGTSAAAPVVSAIAALMQAIRPAGPVLPPDVIRSLLTDSGDEIFASEWQRIQPIRRVNALNAVRSLLNASAPQMIYVADGDSANAGRIVGIDVDPLTGARVSPATPDVVIPLAVTKQTVDGPVSTSVRQPTTLLVSPAGDKLYVVVSSDSMGHGVLVVNTRSNRAIDFVPFSGAGWPAVTGGQPLSVSSLKPPMVFSKDGRLLYVAAGRRLVLINTTTDRVVQDARDLPAPYNGLVGPPPDLAGRLAAIANAIRQGVQTSSGAREGVFMSALALSPDGRTLYAAVNTGGGGGQQAGGLLAIDVDLYTDAFPDAPGLQSDLGSYLSLVTPAVIAQANAGGFLGGDEPQGIAVSRDGTAAYLVNGGLNFFQSIPTDEFDIYKYQDLLLGPALTFNGATGGLAGVMNGISSFINTSSALFNELRDDVLGLASSGITFVGAPGVTAVFDLPAGGGGPPIQEWVFPSDVGFGWNPTGANGGSVINQFRFREVFAKRPFGLAMRPDGKRALVPFFQTGNFGVLDVELQAAFEAPPVGTPKAGISALPDDIFHGFLAVTDSLRFDSNLWPRRGAFAEGTRHVPGPDENFLYPWHAEYAQNGRWAAAVHVGVRGPGTISAVVPSHEEIAERLRTEMSAAELGGQDPAPGTALSLVRGGGGLTIIDDEALTAALEEDLATATNAATTDNQTSRPYFATLPACGERVANDNGTVVSGCSVQSVEYLPSGGPQRFFRPRGVTIQPFVSIESPRFGDHVTKATGVQVLWRDGNVREVWFEVFDPANLDADGNAAQLGSVLVTLSLEQIQRRSVDWPLGDLFGATPPVQGAGYRVAVRIVNDVNETVSATSIDVTYDDPGVAQGIDPPGLTLTPFLMPFLQVPAAGSAPRQLNALFEPANSDVEEDVTFSADVTYLWLTDLQSDPPLVASSSGVANEVISFLADETVRDVVQGMLNEIKAKLAENNIEPDFALAPISVTPQGGVTISGGGLNVVQAIYEREGSRYFSNPVIVFGGLELSKIDLEPSSVLNTALAQSGAETLVKKLGTALGKKVNSPLVLTPTAQSGFSYLDNKGEIELADVEFKYLGEGTISLKELMETLEKMIGRSMRKAILKRLGPVNPVGAAAGAAAATVLTHGLMALIEETVTEIGIQFVDLQSTDTAVATIDNVQGSIYKGDVTAAGPGIAAVKGELDLGGFGKKADTVPVFVLPQITEAVMDPINILLCRADSPEPGRKVRTLATAVFTPQITLDPQSLGLDGDINEFIELFLPAVVPVGTPFDIPVRLGDFEVRFKGTVQVDGDTLVWDDTAIAFTVPNVPGVTNEYNFIDVADIARVAEPRDIFSSRIVHQGVVGRSRITNFVTVPILGSAQALGSVTVTELCSTPFVTKKLTSGTVVTAPGEQMTYVVTVANPGAAPIEDVRVTEVATYVARERTGDPDQDLVEVTQVIPIGTLEPRSYIEVPIVLPAPTNFFGEVSNRATATGSSGSFTNTHPCQFESTTPCPPAPPPPPPPPPPSGEPVEPPFCQLNPTAPECITQPPSVSVLIGGPFITEMVLAPQRDWNDSAGGNGNPFDATPGNGTVDGSDVWIEVAATTPTAGWTLRLTDATGATFDKVVGAPVLGSYVKVISGFGVGSSPIVRVNVIDNLGLTRQSVDVTAIESAVGAATGAGDEALTWSIYGSPTPVLQQFLRRPASIGVFSPF